MKRWALLLFLFALPAFGQSSFYQLPSPLPNATIYVCPVQPITNPCSAPASIFSDSGLTSPVSQPVHLGSDGNFGFWVTQAQYTVQVQAPYNLVYTINLGGGATSLAFNKITAGSNTAALTMGTGGNFSPLNIGQVAGSQMWLAPGLSAPSATCSTTGGTIIAGQQITLAYTLNTAAGQTLPSIFLNGVSGCSGSTNSITVNAPTQPSGYTGWTAYYCNGSGSPSCTAPVQVASCINITGNCVITSSANGTTALPTINTAWIQPPNVQAFNGAPGEIPSIFFPKADGNYYPWASVEWASCDATGGPPLPCGTPVITHRTYFSDIPGNNVQYNSPIAYKNSFISLSHRYGVGTVLTNQDRGLAVFTENSPVNDTATYKGLFGIQQELDINGAPTITGAVDSNVIGIQGQISAVMTATPSTKPAMMAAIYANVGMGGTGYLSSSGNKLFGVNSVLQNNVNSSAPAGTIWDAYNAQWQVVTGVGTNIFGAGYSCTYPTSGSKFTSNTCFYIPNASGYSSPGSGDTFMRNEWNTAPGLPWDFAGPVFETGITNMNPNAAFPFNASVNLTGSLATAQMTTATSGISSVGCSGGASSYTYQLVFVDANGGQAAAAGQNTTAGCTNPLTSGNPAVINVAVGSLTDIRFASAVRVDVYRTAGPMPIGKIGSLTCSFNLLVYGCSNFTDTGLSASGSVPTVNSTGSVAPQFVSNTNGGAANKIAGTCTAAAATTCTVTFTNPYASAPVCTATDASNITTLKVTPSTGSLVITTTGATSDVFDYICVGNPN